MKINSCGRIDEHFVIDRETKNYVWVCSFEFGSGIEKKRKYYIDDNTYYIKYTLNGDEYRHFNKVGK